MPHKRHEHKKTVLSFLRKYPLGTVGTVDEEGAPDLAPVYMYVEDNLVMYFVTKTQTRKSDNLRKNGNLSFLVCDERSLTTVEVKGHAVPVHDTIEFARIFDAFHTLFASRPGKRWLPPIAQIRAGMYVAFRVIPMRICHRTFSRTKEGIKKPKEIILRPRYKRG